ncbi:hypothetical protein QBC38DRAFT_465343 [Podospora fimiseda]|uniref:Uncharacterized protein n=1 Tax=Podospora fimiseda TaxID=252190 RepID=A0AAN7BXY5_9PEZI|nr:hypothetical protein QBC38DRAFT_465343 [Podospora fimiseda]
MEAVSAYSLTTLAWLSAQAIPLIIWPSFISTLISTDSSHYHPARLHDIEKYFARSLGLSQLTLGLILLILSGALPLSDSSTTEEISPYATATILITTIYHSSAAFYSYARYTQSDHLAYQLGCFGSSTLAAFGLYVLLFAGDTKRVSKRTGADKNTSGWPFKNSEAEKKKGKKRI